MKASANQVASWLLWGTCFGNQSHALTRAIVRLATRLYEATERADG